MTLTITPAGLETKLKSLADDFAQIASHASTLAECDKWNADAEQLRVVANLTARGMATPSVAQAFIKAAEKRLEAEEAAIHESRASRRERAL